MHHFSLFFPPSPSHAQEKHERDYLAWLMGKFTPSPKKLSLMKEAGLLFPEQVETVEANANQVRGNP